MRPLLLLLAIGSFCGCRATDARHAEPANGGKRGSPLWMVRSQGGAEPIATGTLTASLLDATACQSCHAELYQEWQQSRHGLAWTNSIFLTEYNESPRAWCVNCHAPTDAQAVTSLVDRSQGVNCASCHVRNGRMVNRMTKTNSPHRTVVDASFGGAAFCADCHQFKFPVLGADGKVERFTSQPMQSTVSQFSQGPYANGAGGCATCHATTYGHGFPGSHDSSFLSAALSVTTCRTATQLRVTIKNIAAGHNVPTGDIHSHINVDLWDPLAPQKMFRGVLGRSFEALPDGGKKTIADTTLPPQQATTFAIDVASLMPDIGSTPDRFELALSYVFIADDVPDPRRKLEEPSVTEFFDQSLKIASVTMCSSSE
jgi:hypothetical protein